MRAGAGDIIGEVGIAAGFGTEGKTFSTDPNLIHYGDNSGFQALNLAILFGARVIVLVGFNMSGQNMFRPGDSRNQYAGFVKSFEKAAETIPAGVRIINATPGSALHCFEKMELDEALLLDKTSESMGSITQLESTG